MVRGGLLTAGQLMGYDATKKVCRKHLAASDGPLLHVCAASVAALCAATFAAPADVLQTKVMAGGGAGGVLGCAAAIRNAEGLAGFFRGWTMSFARLLPTFAVGSTIYEQCRLLLGLRYLE